MEKTKKINMITNRTFTMIKPEEVLNNNIGPIIDMIEKNGFEIINMKKHHLTQAQAEAFYGIHREKPFFQSLVAYMISGPVIAIILEKENAVENYRAFIGSTDPSKAAEGTLRSIFGRSVQSNAVHGSDSDENAMLEGLFFFSKIEQIG
jgi:nucleoside-diphosphate kinase